ncbi:hypothetical protein [Streptomyces sp. CAU 1734]|uniref:hypothetical protein n=1 Tax=Streptomyces sp. CAU 1734 TaxID=3140360 RepID=UPI003260D731
MPSEADETPPDAPGKPTASDHHSAVTARVTHLMTRWPEDDPGRQTVVAQLLAELPAHPHVLELVTDELLCDAVCTVAYQRRGFLPETEAGLVHAVTERLLDPPASGSEPVLPLSARRFLAQALALPILTTGANRLPRAAAREVIASRLPYLVGLPSASAGTYLDQLTQETRIVRPLPDGAVTLAHPKVVSHLAAHACLAEAPAALDVLLACSHTPEGADAVVFAAGHARTHESAFLLLGLLDRSDMSPHRRAELTRRALGQVATVAPDVRLEVLVRIAEASP